MLALKYLTVITKREYFEQYVEFFHQHNVNGVVSMLCNGTAPDSMLSKLSLEKTEKIMIFVMIPENQLGGVVKGLLHQMNIGAPGNGA